MAHGVVSRQKCPILKWKHGKAALRRDRIG